MRTLLTLLTLSAAVAAVPAAQPPVPMGPPTAAATDALLADVLGRNQKAAEESARKLVGLGPTAVPALTHGLWADSATRRACVALLAQIGADARPAAPSLVRLLGFDDAETRAAAARALGHIGAHSAVPALTKALEDKSAAVRLGAADSLVALSAGADAVLPVLTKALKDGSAEESYAAARLLAELGPEAAPAVPELNGMLPGAEPLMLARLAEALARVGPGAKDALDALKARLRDDKNPAPFRVPAALALWRIGRDPDAAPALRAGLAKTRGRGLAHGPLWRVDRSKQTEDALVKRLGSEDPDEVVAAAEALGPGSKGAAAALARLVQPGLEPERLLAVLALLSDSAPAAPAWNKDALALLQRIAESKAPGASVPAAVALYRAGPTPQAARVLTDFLDEKELRAEAAAALKQLRPSNQAAVVELGAALDSPDEAVQMAAAVALWRIERSPQALPVMVKRLRSEDARVREQAATDIGFEFGPDAKDAVPELVKRLFDPFASVRSASAEAMGRIGPAAKDATGPLLALLDGDEPAFVQSAACEALGLIRPADKDDAMAVLAKKLEHPGALVRAHAALALFLTAGDKTGEQEANKLLGHRTHHVRITAAEAAWRMGQHGRAVPLLVRALEEGNLDGTAGENERYMAARALGRIGAAAKAAVPELVRLIDHRDDALARSARAALKAIDPEAATSAGVK